MRYLARSVFYWQQGTIIIRFKVEMLNRILFEDQKELGRNVVDVTGSLLSRSNKQTCIFR